MYLWRYSHPHIMKNVQWSNLTYFQGQISQKGYPSNLFILISVERANFVLLESFLLVLESLSLRNEKCHWTWHFFNYTQWIMTALFKPLRWSMVVIPLPILSQFPKNWYYNPITNCNNDKYFENWQLHRLGATPDSHARPATGGLFIAGSEAWGCVS